MDIQHIVHGNYHIRNIVDGRRQKLEITICGSNEFTIHINDHDSYPRNEFSNVFLFSDHIVTISRVISSYVEVDEYNHTKFLISEYDLKGTRTYCNFLEFRGCVKINSAYESNDHTVRLVGVIEHRHGTSNFIMELDVNFEPLTRVITRQSQVPPPSGGVCLTEENYVRK